LSCLWIILHPLLIFDVLFDDFQRRTTNGREHSVILTSHREPLYN